MLGGVFVAGTGERRIKRMRGPSDALLAAKHTRSGADVAACLLNGEGIFYSACGGLHWVRHRLYTRRAAQPQVLYGINQRLRVEDVDSPLCTVRPVKTVQLVVITGDRGLCGGYNNFVLKKAEQRYKELTELGCEVQVVAIGRKGQVYFKRRPKFNIVSECWEG